ncbi:MAG: small multi-drug export protein [Candidatus Omnitrophica bacterium]|nr:small multi-drug export protein [Candidatus Omnitrophota bacterium]
MEPGNLLVYLQGLSKEWATFIVAMLPLSELRAAMPIGITLGLSPTKAFWLSVLGNSVIILPVLFLLEPFSNSLMHFKPWKLFFARLFNKAKEKGSIPQILAAAGIMVFVALPFPMAGAWGGCIAASFLRIKLRYALPAILLGVLISGIIVLSVYPR